MNIVSGVNFKIIHISGVNSETIHISGISTLNFYLHDNVQYAGSVSTKIRRIVARQSVTRARCARGQLYIIAYHVKGQLGEHCCA